MKTALKILCSILLLSSLNVYSQQTAILPSDNQEAIKGSIDNIRTKLESEDPDIRRGAVMLLGKYASLSEAQSLLISIIKDTAPEVRRAAAVSITENVNSLASEHSVLILEMLVDPDREVREIIAGSISFILLKEMNNRRFSLQFGSTPNNPPNSNALIQRIIEQALEDESSIVRMKSLQALPLLRGNLPFRAMLNRLVDQDQEVKLTAYEIIGSLLPADKFVEAIEALPYEEDRRCRLLTAEILGLRAVPKAKKLLQALKNDNDEEVRLIADASWFYAGFSDTISAALKQALIEGKLDRRYSNRLFLRLNTYSQMEKRTVSYNLLDSQDAFVRSKAASLWIISFDGFPPISEVLELLNDHNSMVRQSSISALSLIDTPPPEELVFELPEAIFEDVRLNAFRITRLLPPGPRMELASWLLIDTSMRVRQAALREIVILKPANWRKLLSASLRDTDFEVQKLAANALLKQMGPEGIEIAIQFSELNKEKRISQWIQKNIQ